MFQCWMLPPQVLGIYFFKKSYIEKTPFIPFVSYVLKIMMDAKMYKTLHDAERLNLF